MSWTLDLLRRKSLSCPPRHWTNEGQRKFHRTYRSPHHHSKAMTIIITCFKTSICNYRYLPLWTTVWFVVGLKYLITFLHPCVDLWLSGHQVCGLITLHGELVLLTKLICHRQEYESTIMLYFRVSNSPHQNYKPMWLTPCLVVSFQSIEITEPTLQYKGTRYLIIYIKHDIIHLNKRDI